MTLTLSLLLVAVPWVCWSAVVEAAIVIMTTTQLLWSQLSKPRAVLRSYLSLPLSIFRLRVDGSSVHFPTVLTIVIASMPVPVFRMIVSSAALEQSYIMW